MIFANIENNPGLGILFFLISTAIFICYVYLKKKIDHVDICWQYFVWPIAIIIGTVVFYKWGNNNLVISICNILLGAEAATLITFIP